MGVPILDFEEARVSPLYLGLRRTVELQYPDYSIRQDDGAYLDLLKNWKIGILRQIRCLTQLSPHKSGAPGSDLSIGRHGRLLRVGKGQNRGRDFG